MSFFERLKRLLGGSGNGQAATSAEGKVSTAVQPITCMEALERVQEYLDGELDHVSHDEVARHFSMCKRCYPHLRLEERFKDLLHRSQSEEACPDSVRERVMELLGSQGEGD
jgi:anti-sigma factor (TIGR02949 family)